MSISPQSLRRPDWLQIWAGGWSILSCSHFAEEYVRLIKFHGKPFLPESIIFIRHAKSEGWARQRDREAICEYLAREVLHNTSRAKEICRHLKRESDGLRAFMERYWGQLISEKLYRTFWDKLVQYYQPHINVKYVVDGLPAKRLQELLPYFEDARRYAEDVLNQTEKFLEELARKIGKKEKVAPHLILCCTRDEMYHYFHSGTLPSVTILKKRDALFGIFHDQHREATYVGAQAKALMHIVKEVHADNVLHGMTAYPGVAQGVVRIVPDPRKCRVFHAGDILVSGMTRPEFLPLMKKAAAFVTDSGGILSHAAIVARELKKPCVIGTKVATKILKDGDRVEVNASKGMVKRLGKKT